MNKLVSVIVPIYNVEKYLKRCVDSIINQTYKNLEIWLVDDGSTDLCPKICDEYSKLDDRIKVIHKENGGLSDARNVAMDQMNGEYVMFVDSDDFIHPEMVERLIDYINFYDTDITIGRLEKGGLDNFKCEKLDSLDNSRKTVKLLENIEIHRALFDDYFKGSMVPACGKIYKSKIIADIRFPVKKIHEDEYVVHYILDKCKKIAFTDEYLYYHFYRDNSITNTKYSLKSIDAVEAIEERCKFYEAKKDEELIFLSYRDYLRRIQYHYYSLKKYFPEEIPKIDKIKSNYKNMYRKIVNQMSIKDKIRYGLFVWMPNANKLIKSLLGAKKI